MRMFQSLNKEERVIRSKISEKMKSGDLRVNGSAASSAQASKKRR